MQLEDLFQPLDMISGLAEVLFEALFQLRGGDLRDHLRKGLRDLLLGVVDVLQGVDEKVVQ